MVVDASVIVSRFVPQDAHHEPTRKWLTRHVAHGGLVIAPTLLLAEIAGAVLRRTPTPSLARRTVVAVLGLPALRLLAVDEPLAHAAASLAGRLRMRGADAVYIAAAATLGLPLVTWDVEQRERAREVIDVFVPHR
jgi:predicted nucleic acid-binding protein